MGRRRRETPEELFARIDRERAEERQRLREAAERYEREWPVAEELAPVAGAVMESKGRRSSLCLDAYMRRRHAPRILLMAHERHEERLLQQLGDEAERRGTNLRVPIPGAAGWFIGVRVK